jgi:hypothetical protein
MNYTYRQNGIWEATKWVGNDDIHISTKDEYGDMYRFIASCGNPKPDTLPHNPNAEGNGKLIVAAVNACIKLNADNPLAVARAIENLHKASDKAYYTWEQEREGDLEETMRSIFNTLTKIKGVK